MNQGSEILRLTKKVVFLDKIIKKSMSKKKKNKKNLQINKKGSKKIPHMKAKQDPFLTEFNLAEYLEKDLSEYDKKILEISIIFQDKMHSIKRSNSQY